MNVTLLCAHNKIELNEAHQPANAAMEFQRHPNNGSKESENRWNHAIQGAVENVQIHGDRVSHKYNLACGNYCTTNSGTILVHAANEHIKNKTKKKERTMVNH